MYHFHVYEMFFSTCVCDFVFKMCVLCKMWSCPPILNCFPGVLEIKYGLSKWRSQDFIVLFVSINFPYIILTSKILLFALGSTKTVYNFLLSCYFHNFMNFIIYLFPMSSNLYQISPLCYGSSLNLLKGSTNSQGACRVEISCGTNFKLCILNFCTFYFNALVKYQLYLYNFNSANKDFSFFIFFHLITKINS